MNNNKITYSSFNSVKEIAPDFITKNFDDFSNDYVKPTILADKLGADCINFSRHDNKIKNVSLRELVSISQISGVMLDIDNKSGIKLTIKKAKHILKSLKIKFILHTSFQHTDIQPRFRIAIPFSQAISPEYSEEIYNFFNKILNYSVDPCSKNPAQIYFTPTCTKENHAYYDYYINKIGAFFDPLAKGLKRKQLEIASKKNPDKKRKLPTVEYKTVNVDLDDLDINSRIEEIIITGDTSDYESRSEAIFEIVQELIGRKQSNNKIISLLLNKKYKISERCLEIGPKAVMQDIQRIRKKINKSNPVIENIEPYYSQPKYYLPQEASELMENKMTSWVAEPKGDRAIEASAGSGKTREISGVIANSEYKFEYYVQRIELAEEIRKKLVKNYPKLLHKTKVIRGRTHKDVNGNTLCQKPDVVDKVIKYGLNIYKSLCKDSKMNVECQHFNVCPYLAQNDSDIKIKFLTHAPLGIERGLIDSELPDRAIIDESYFSNLIEKKKTTLVNIKKQLGYNPLAKSICYALKTKKALLAYLRNKYGIKLKDMIDDAITDMDFFKPKISPEMTDNKIYSELKTINLKASLVQNLLQMLKSELFKFPDRKDSITVRYVENKVEIASRKEITRFTNQGENHDINISVLCIDADFNKNISKVFFPNIKRLKIKIERNAHVTQVISTRNSKSRFTTRHLSDQNEQKKEIRVKKLQIERLQKVVNKLSQDSDTLIIGYGDVVGNPNKGIPPLIALPKGAEFEHFGNLRGIDKHKDKQVVIIIGRWQFPSHVLEAQAAALWWDRKVPPELDQELVGVVRGYSNP